MRNYKNIFILVVSLLLGIIVESSAQENILSLFKKYENSELVESSNYFESKVKNYSKESPYMSKTITVNGNSDIIKEFIEAFSKDKENAAEIVEKMDKGTLISANYNFITGKGKELDCMFSRSYDNTVTIGISEEIVGKKGRRR